jgi:hypothetical protein
MTSAVSDKSTRVNVDAFPLTGKSVAVQITHGRVVQCYDLMCEHDTADIRRISQAIMRNAMSVDERRVVARIRAGDDAALREWDEFGTDVLLLYVARWIVNGTRIPLTSVEFDGKC